MIGCGVDSRLARERLFNEEGGEGHLHLTATLVVAVTTGSLPILSESMYAHHQSGGGYLPLRDGRRGRVGILNLRFRQQRVLPALSQHAPRRANEVSE